ncbi:hypothetical protein L208DRAFT_1420425 [Tricholoma matsutake]|nr:hypothetical protein L208DRAFT_1420425 [Tricholoma matsutake 945]
MSALSSIQNSKRYSLLDEEQTYYWDDSRKGSPYPGDRNNWFARSKIMDISTTASRSSQPEHENVDYEDWEELKELFAKAADQYEDDETSEALPLLRGVIHECHRFLLVYEDPSVMFMNRPTQGDQSFSAVSIASSDNRSTRHYSGRRADSAPSTSANAPLQAPKERKRKIAELPTAFHAILGTALFLSGNIIAQNPASALAEEPDNAVTYWLAALDVFESGENLPIRTNGLMSRDTPEDWRMAIVWGRTLVCIADETITRGLKEKQAESGMGKATPSQPLSPTAYFAADDPKWPPESPFSTIVARRPPVTCRMSLTSATPNDLMMLAMDHFSHGIFHMPHPRRMQSSGGIATPPPAQESFSRAKELFTIASEVLLLSEKLDIPSERQRWASWADSVFSQMKMEADMDAWRGPITRARGRCWLIIGAARAEELETALEHGEMGVLQSEDAEDAREGLSTAISFFEHAKSSATATALGDPAESHELQSLLAEALLNLANLTEDEGKREELYARAQLESGGDLDLLEDDGAMDESE